MQSAYRRHIALGLLITLVTAGLAAAAASPRYTLRLHRGEGDKATYACTYATREKASGPGAPAGPITSNAQLTCAIEFQGASPGGDVVVQTRVGGGRAKAKLGGQSQTIPAKTSVVSYVVTSRAMPKQSELLSGSLTQISPGGLQFAPDDVLPPPLPDKPVAVGDRWQSSARTPAETGRPEEAREAKYDSRVVGQVTYAGRSCLKISTSFRQSQHGTLEAPDGSGTATFTARSTGGGTWLFDPKAGLMMKSDVNGTVVLTRVVKMHCQQEQIFKVSSTFHAQVGMTEYNGRKIAAK